MTKLLFTGHTCTSTDKYGKHISSFAVVVVSFPTQEQDLEDQLNVLDKEKKAKLKYIQH